MLQQIRDGLQGQKWLAWVLLGAVALTFIFWGGSHSLDFTGTGKSTAAEVDGEEIPASDATQQWSEMQARWSRQFNTEIPPEQRVAMQKNILDGLVMRKLIDKRLEDSHYRVSQATVLAEFQKIPAFHNADGKFDPALARLVLQQNNRTEQQLFADTRSQLLVSQLQQGIGGSYFLTPAESKRLYELENEEREVQYVSLAADKFEGTEPIDEAAIKAYYDKNGDRFMTIESVALEYAELRLENLAAQLAPTDAELQKMYEENRASYVQDERRSARLIVISGTDGAALKKADGIVAQARAGKDFAELARQYSTDASAAQGGDLGFVQKRDFIGPVGDALFSMKVGDVSEPLKAEDGYHIVKLEQIQAGESKPFAEVRAELDSQYRTEHAADLFGERQEEIQARLEKGTSDLDTIARDYGLTRGSIPEFLRGGGAEPLGSNVELQQVVFSDATLNQNKIGGPVALGEDRLVLVKVTAHHKAEVKPLAAVREEIVELLKHERGAERAKAAAEAALAKLNAGEKLEAIAKAQNVTVEPARFVGRADPSIPAALRTSIFEAPRPADKPVIRTATLDDGSTALFVVTRSRIATTNNAAMTAEMNQQLQQRSAQGEITAYVEEAKRKAKIVTNPAVFE